VAYVSGYYDGRCVIEPLNRAMVLPVNMALYTTPPAAQGYIKGDTRSGLVDNDFGENP
jgi:hypothetical protein